jgi:hypothetical protein
MTLNSSTSLKINLARLPNPTTINMTLDEGMVSNVRAKKTSPTFSKLNDPLDHKVALDRAMKESAVPNKEIPNQLSRNCPTYRGRKRSNNQNRTR